MTRTLTRAATIGIGLAVIALPAMAAGQAPATSSTTTAVVADGAVTAAPAVGSTTGADVDDTATTASEATAPATQQASQETSPAPATAAAAQSADESGSTETETVQRACDAPEDPHYEPASGRDASACYEGGTFQPGNTYTATHYTNDVRCGGENVLVPVDPAGAYVSGNGDGGADGGGGYLQACSDDALPIQGRATARGDVGASGDFTTSATADGDKDNPEETSQGWATVTITPAGPEQRCGKSYAEGGRADSDHPTSEDTADECG